VRDLGKSRKRWDWKSKGGEASERGFLGGKDKKKIPRKKIQVFYLQKGKRRKKGTETKGVKMMEKGKGNRKRKKVNKRRKRGSISWLKERPRKAPWGREHNSKKKRRRKKQTDIKHVAQTRTTGKSENKNRRIQGRWKGGAKTMERVEEEKRGADEMKVENKWAFGIHLRTLDNHLRRRGKSRTGQLKVGNTESQEKKNRAN